MAWLLLLTWWGRACVGDVMMWLGVGMWSDDIYVWDGIQRRCVFDLIFF
jgi:hypothetical protein